VALLLVLAALAGLVLLFLWKRDEILQRACLPLTERQQAECQKQMDALASLRPMPPVPSPPGSAGPPEEVRRWAEVTGVYPRWPDDLLAPRDCEEAEEDLRILCRELDLRSPTPSRSLEGGTFGLILRVTGELAARLPVASGELRQPGAVVANAFHLFRVLGKERMEILREMLRREEEFAEPMAMALHRWLSAQERCGQDHARVRPEVIHEYAAFLLNTLGGQGYVRRRSPRVAALTTFYALLILDQAFQKGTNPHGVDLRPHIPLCRELLKVQPLVFRDRYLEILQTMETRWTTR
jgi:hypothetical protein